MSLKIKRAIYFSFVIMSVFIMLNFISLVTPKEIGTYLSILEIFCLIFLFPLFFYLGNVYTKKLKLVTNHSRYSNKLNELIIEESHNPLFYQGNINEGGKILTKKISEVLDVDRVSIWLYGKNKNSIICKLLYKKKDNTWDEGTFLNKKDFISYFNRLETDPIIVANNAEKNEATSCFTERYLRPNKMCNESGAIKGPKIEFRYPLRKDVYEKIYLNNHLFFYLPVRVTCKCGKEESHRLVGDGPNISGKFENAGKNGYRS